jgi:hypothetical protein
MYMTMKERIHAAVDRIDEEDLDELYRLIQRFLAEKESAAKPSILSKLKSIHIEGPADFATYLDQYLSGEKCAEKDLH